LKLKTHDLSYSFQKKLKSRRGLSILRENFGRHPGLRRPALQHIEERDGSELKTVSMCRLSFDSTLDLLLMVVRTCEISEAWTPGYALSSRETYSLGPHGRERQLCLLCTSLNYTCPHWLQEL
jgi:hypothetical protein